jgi:hypothetical protein
MTEWLSRVRRTERISACQYIITFHCASSLPFCSCTPVVDSDNLVDQFCLAQAHLKIAASSLSDPLNYDPLRQFTRPPEDRVLVCKRPARFRRMSSHWPTLWSHTPS